MRAELSFESCGRVFEIENRERCEGGVTGAFRELQGPPDFHSPLGWGPLDLGRH